MRARTRRTAKMPSPRVRAARHKIKAFSGLTHTEPEAPTTGLSLAPRTRCVAESRRGDKFELRPEQFRRLPFSL
jgi:hypothetical protein